MKSIKLLFSFFCLMLLVSCFHSKETSVDPSHIKINDDIYLKPLGKNEIGCSTFSSYSLTGKVVTQVIYFLDQSLQMKEFY